MKLEIRPFKIAANAVVAAYKAAEVVTAPWAAKLVVITGTNNFP